MATDDNANTFSVPCSIDGCHVTVVHDARCAEHGGHPSLEWAETEFGDVSYSVHKDVLTNGNTQQEGAPDASTDQ